MIDLAFGLAQRLPPRAFHLAAAASFALRREQRLLLLDDLVTRGGVAVDAGAWWGPWTFWLARRCSEVWAFEPSPELAQHLRAASPDHVKVEQVALSDIAGVHTLIVPAGRGRDALARLASTNHEGPADHSGTGAAELHEVHTRRLDEYHFDRLDFVKIDVEAHEFPLLRGARETLATHRPVILIEIEQRFLDHPIDEVFEWFADLDYHGWVRRNRSWSPLSTFDVDADQRAFEHTPKSTRYLNNFVFTPTTSRPGS